VLNARRHRDGDRSVIDVNIETYAACSTPGGIETVIGATEWKPVGGVSQCSTPGGIETVIG